MKEGDWIGESTPLGLKENQLSLVEDVRLLFANADEKDMLSILRFL